MVNGMRLDQLAEAIGGVLRGNGGCMITGAETLQAATGSHISFAANAKFLEQVRTSCAAAVVVTEDFPETDKATIVVPDVLESFAEVVSLFRPPRELKWDGVSPQAFVHPTAQLGESVQVYPGAFIDADVQIGAGAIVHAGVRILAGSNIGASTTLFPNAVIYENCEIGRRCLIHAGAVIGAYGFGYDSSSGKHLLSAQVGNVEIGDDVEIGAGATIDRGTFGATRIGSGTKIDNQVMIGHNCQIGEHNLLCSQVGIAGSCTTGNYVVMAGQVGIGDHLDIGDRAILGAKAGVMTKIPDGESWVGIPATPMREQLQKQAALAKLPQMRKQLRALEQEIAELSASIEEGDESDQSDKHAA